MNIGVRAAVLAALVAAGPAVALAQVTPSLSPAPVTTTEAAQPAAPAVPPAPVATATPAEQPPKWTIGAGLGSIGYWQLPEPSSSYAITGLGFYGQSIPVATFFLERRVGERTWLVLGAAGTVNRDRFDAPTTAPSVVYTPSALTKDDAERGSLSAGLRRVVTRRGAPVEVSLQAMLEGGYVHQQLEYTTSAGAKSEIRDTGGYGAVTAGIAVERELTGGLGLRISTPLLGASWSQLERKDATGTRDGSSTRVFATIAPRLELRLAF
jgi:hypothetical protein